MEVGRSSLPFIYLLNLTGNPEFLQRVRDKIDITFQTSGVHKCFKWCFNRSKAGGKLFIKPPGVPCLCFNSLRKYDYNNLPSFLIYPNKVLNGPHPIKMTQKLIKKIYKNREKRRKQLQTDTKQDPCLRNFSTNK